MSKRDTTRKRRCARCRRHLTRFEANVSGIGDLCHPDNPLLPDCYTETMQDGLELNREYHVEVVQRVKLRETT